MLADFRLAPWTFRGWGVVNYFPRVAVLGSSGLPIRRVHASLAQAMVAAGAASAVPSRGRISEVTLSRPAAGYAEPDGPATGTALGGTKFTRWVCLDSGTRVIEHHPRCLVDFRLGRDV